MSVMNPNIEASKDPQICSEQDIALYDTQSSGINVTTCKETVAILESTSNSVDKTKMQSLKVIVTTICGLPARQGVLSYVSPILPCCNHIKPKISDFGWNLNPFLIACVTITYTMCHLDCNLNFKHHFFKRSLYADPGSHSLWH